MKKHSFVTFKDVDFIKMRFNITQVPKNTSLVTIFEELRIYPEFINPEPIIFTMSDGGVRYFNRDHVARYYIYAYDPKSPLQEIKDVLERKQIAAEKSFLSDVPDIDVITRGFCPEANEILKCFFKILNYRKFELWQTSIDFYSDLTDQVRSGVPPETLSDDKLATTYRNKMANLKDAFDLIDKIDKLEQELFASNEDLRTMMSKTESTTSGRKGAIELRAAQKNKAISSDVYTEV